MGIGFPPDPFAALNTTFHSSMTAPIGTNTIGTNYFRYRNPRVDALLDEVADVVDPVRQRQLFAQIQDYIIDDVPFLTMYNTGPRVPHYYGTRYRGWAQDIPAFANRAVIQIYEIR
jgi:ABC-type transport system substrate-binding protein